jgi:hypothetical protein
MRDRVRVPRQPQAVGPEPGSTGWLSLDDDELLFRIQSLPMVHDNDADLLTVLRSGRHFFLRQEAAKRVRETNQLKAFASDRHVGQVLVRQMTRADDAAYLEMILRESRHLEVREAASAQLRLLRQERAREGLPGDLRPGRPPR